MWAEAVDNLEAAATDMKATGVSIVGGGNVMFVHPRSSRGVLLQLFEKRIPEAGGARGVVGPDGAAAALVIATWRSLLQDARSSQRPVATHQHALVGAPA